MTRTDTEGATSGGTEAGSPCRRLPVPDLHSLPRARLEAMRDAAATLLQCQRVLRKSSMSVVSEVLRGQGTVRLWERYPKGDVFDPDTHSHYFYHAHARDEMAAGETGHFHLFLRPAGLAPDRAPWALQGAPVPDDPDRRFVHLCAVSVDGYGRPLRLFTTNRWVTDETLYRAGDVIAMLPNFALEVAHPNWAVNRWLAAMVALYRPQIEGLLALRDELLDEWSRRHPEGHVTENRQIQNTSEIAIDIAGQIDAIEAALGT
jgi:hypothetical protein